MNALLSEKEIIMLNRDVNKFICLGFGALYAGRLLMGGDVNDSIIAHIFLAALFIITAGAEDNE